MARRRGHGTASDMGRSLVLVIGFSLFVLLLNPARQLLFPSGSRAEAVKTVDYADQTAAAKKVSSDALVPNGLPSSWRATSVRFEPTPLSLHIGFVTPADKYAALEETTGDASSLLRALGVRGGGPERQTKKGEIALVITHGRATAVVTGSAGLVELRALAASLR